MNSNLSNISTHKETKMKGSLIVPAIVFLGNLIASAQDQRESPYISRQADSLQIIPDKVLETAVPLLFILVVLNILVHVLRQRSENILKRKMIEAGISEEALIEMFHEGNVILRLQPLKWFLFLFATGLGLITLDLFRNQLTQQSGYLSVGILLMFISAATLVYYQILTRSNGQPKPKGKKTDL